MRRALKRAIRRETERGFRRGFEYPRMRKEIPPDHLKASYTLTPTMRGCEWEVDVEIGGWMNVGCFEMAKFWHPGPNRYRGKAKGAAEAAEHAREVVDFVRAVHAELVTKVAPPMTADVIL